MQGIVAIILIVGIILSAVYDFYYNEVLLVVWIFISALIIKDSIKGKEVDLFKLVLCGLCMITVLLSCLGVF